MTDRLDEATARLASLDDDVRRRLYLFIRGRERPVSRDEAAEHVGISRKLAAFHLDKLLDRGLLKAHYARPAGRSGPGAGRSSKLYEPSDLEISVSIPQRRYAFLGELLVAAIEEGTPTEPIRDAAGRVAAARGMELGEEVRRERRLRPPGPERTLSVAREVLEGFGFEPIRREDGSLLLRNCPFSDLALRAPDLVCGMNRAFVGGFLAGLRNAGTVEASLEPEPGRCCVVLRPAS